MNHHRIIRPAERHSISNSAGLTEIRNTVDQSPSVMITPASAPTNMRAPVLSRMSAPVRVHPRVSAPVRVHPRVSAPVRVHPRVSAPAPAPARAITRTYKYKILISTLRGYEQAYNHLLTSLKNAGISDEDILTSYANEPVNDVSGNIIRVKNNIYEYTGILGAHLYGADDSTVFLLLHDTCEVGPKFKEKLEALVRTHRGGFTWACKTGQCNICLFSPDAAKAVYDTFHTYMTIPKMEGIKMEWGEHPLSPKKCKVIQSYSPIDVIHRGTRPVYSSVLRNVIEFPSIDLFKFFVHVVKEGDHPQAP